MQAHCDKSCICRAYARIIERLTGMAFLLLMCINPFKENLMLLLVVLYLNFHLCRIDFEKKKDFDEHHLSMSCNDFMILYQNFMNIEVDVQLLANKIQLNNIY